uniref:AMP-binding enzyme C-terminal domain-containing protein n=1 Tax=Gasterosteus aculeatus aculeatus TaxID=481459 RepID=A0AAQ4QS27_GASAC
MAAVILSDEQTFESRGVFKHVENLLPSYARPRFIRIQTSVEVTGTFKLLKGKLVEEGFNPNQVTDPLYFLDEKDKNYVPLTSALSSLFKKWHLAVSNSGVLRLLSV